MGEMADYINEAHWDDYGEDINGDWYAYGGELSCRYCGVSHLHWSLDERTGKYRLVDAIGYIHTCSKYKKKR